MQLPAGITVDVAGQSVEMDQAREAMLFALALAIFLVYIVLASKFESFRGPFVILLSIPLALVGVVAALSLLEIDVSILVFIGLIMLAGIVVNNAIVLVDYIQQLRDRGQSLDDAIVSACQIRLRPVLITTLTTVLGLLPMALGIGEGAELRTPMAVTVIAGLVSSTLLTLVVVPVLFRVVMQPGAVDTSNTEPSPAE
jgi:HAE1 family hydrophobic/amphiphilic exporter-1